MNNATVNCPDCKKRFSAELEAASVELDCPFCGKTVVLPLQDSSAVSMDNVSEKKRKTRLFLLIALCIAAIAILAAIDYMISPHIDSFLEEKVQEQLQE